jgi:2-polyprenyl-3-methyl-5-hydroxy-6-metoxy-1,4-benzoquinol methylase
MIMSKVAVAPAGGAAAYGAKDNRYFAGARSDYVSLLPCNPSARILEIGCGNGDTGALALAEGKCGWYCGIELCERAADDARKKLSEVLTGDVERMTLPWADEFFDALIISEVLEHLVDPWEVLRKIHPMMKNGAMVFSSSPNVSHYSVIRMLLKGQWSLADKGIMDRTHLRWFTFATYRQMFEEAGYAVGQVAPLCELGPRARLLNSLTRGRFRHLFAQQISLIGHRA